MSWTEWVLLLGDDSVTVKEFAEAHGISESKARARLREAVIGGDLVSKKHGSVIMYKVRRSRIEPSDHAMFCGYNVKHLSSLPEVCTELPHIFFRAMLEVAKEEKLTDRVVYTVETKASEEVASLAVSIGYKAETVGDKLLIVRNIHD